MTQNDPKINIRIVKKSQQILYIYYVYIYTIRRAKKMPGSCARGAQGMLYGVDMM